MLLLAVVMLAACSSGDSDETPSSRDGDCYIEFYVYQPDRPMVTRASDDAVIDPLENESYIHSLKIWAFRHADGEKLGYLEVDETTEKSLFGIMNTTGQQMFKMKVPAYFADNPENVDVYVVANESDGGVSLDETSTREDIKSAKITSFGVSANYLDDAVIKAVPSTGLPMSAMLENQPIYGSFPTLRIGDATQIATLRLTRAVSKLRFVICRKKETGNDKRILESITSIKLNAGMIPTQSFLMPVAASSYPSSSFDDDDAMDYGGIAKTTIPAIDDPLQYAYTTQTPEEYEDLIIEGCKVKENQTTSDLYPFGLTYLRESPKQLTGTIKYTIKKRDNTTTSWDGIEAEDAEDATFSMAAPGEFMRNHSWIIYIYFMDEKLHVLTVTNIGMRNWVEGGSTDHSVYNW